MDSNVLGPHWLGTADGADRNRICASGTLARRRFLTRSTESKSDRRRGSRPNKNKRSGVADKKGVRIGVVTRSYSAGSPGAGFPDCTDRFVRAGRSSYGWSARLLFAVEPGICASRGTSGCGRGAQGNSGVAACCWTTVERKPGVEREVGPFTVYFADVVATRLSRGSTGRARDSTDSRII